MCKGPEVGAVDTTDLFTQHHSIYHLPLPSCAVEPGKLKQCFSIETLVLWLRSYMGPEDAPAQDREGKGR